MKKWVKKCVSLYINYVPFRGAVCQDISVDPFCDLWGDSVDPGGVPVLSHLIRQLLSLLQTPDQAHLGPHQVLLLPLHTVQTQEVRLSPEPL